MPIKGKNIVSNSLFCDSDYTFKTSLEVIQEVMNVPMCALTSLLRANGHNSEIETSSFCIDEKELDIFADAYIRKMRSYFFSSLRNISTLSPKELSNFNKFINLFKKKGLDKDTCKWSNIDIDHLREIFKKQVEERTLQRKPSLSSLAKEVALAILVARFQKKEVHGTYQSINLKLGIKDDTTTSYTFKDEYENIYYKITEKKFYYFDTSHSDTILGIIARKRDSILKEQQEVLHTISQSGYCPIKKIFISRTVPLVSLIVNIITFARYYLYPNNSGNDPSNTISQYV